MGEMDEELMVWIVLFDVSVEVGCMRFISGSYKNVIVMYEDIFDEDNFLLCGQEIVGIDEMKVEYGFLKSG